MGYALHRVEGIGDPFLVAHEQIVLIPARGIQPVQNPVRKLIFVLQGECRHRVVAVPGADAEVPLRAGDVMVIPHTCVHQYVSPTPGTAYKLHALRVAFSPGAVPPLEPGAPVPPELGDPETSLSALVRQQFREFRHLPGAQDARIRETLAQYREEAHRRSSGYRLRVRGLLTSLVTLVARQLSQAREQVPSTTEDRRAHHVTQVKEYVLRHLDQPLRLGDIADHVQLREEYLARLFRELTGVTVFDYVRKNRFERAKTLLSSSDLNVEEIARRTGFNSLPVFSRTFKRHVGASPTEYRRLVDAEIG